MYFFFFQGDAWITVTVPRKDKKQNKQATIQNGGPAKPSSKSPKVSAPKGSGGDKVSQKVKKEDIVKEGGGRDGSKEVTQKQKGSPKKVGVEKLCSFVLHF